MLHRGETVILHSPCRAPSSVKENSKEHHAQVNSYIKAEAAKILENASEVEKLQFQDFAK